MPRGVPRTVTVKGHGTFATRRCGHWSSHHAAVVFRRRKNYNVYSEDEEESDLDSEEYSSEEETEDDYTWDVEPIFFFRQKPLNGNSYVKPTFKPAEMERMTEKARRQFEIMEQPRSGEAQNVSDGMDFTDVPIEEAERLTKLHEVDLCERCQQVTKFPCTGIVEVLSGVFARIRSPQVLRIRMERLRRGGDTTLYHVTDRISADLIRESGKMIRGTRGVFGGAIYFAETPEAARRKARKSGVTLKCVVRLGTTKRVTTKLDPDSPLRRATFSCLANDGFDSITATYFRSGTEFVVYNSDQVIRTTEV